MTKLTDTQCVLLSAASNRDRLSIYPLPGGLKPQGGLAKAMSLLSQHCLVEERETTNASEVYRIDGDYRYGLYVTTAGLSAIGVECGGGGGDDVVKLGRAPATKPTTKTDNVLDLLRRDSGATLDELVLATGWLPHSTRAALTGLKQKGHVIERDKRSDTTCYFIRAAA